MIQRSYSKGFLGKHANPSSTDDAWFRSKQLNVLPSLPSLEDIRRTWLEGMRPAMTHVGVNVSSREQLV